MIVLPTPAPCRVIALVIVIPVDHVNVPTGIVIVSPFWACVSWICWIFCGVPSEFQTAAAQRGPEKPLKIRINRRIPDSFIIAAYRSLRLAARLHIRMESAWQENFFCPGPFFCKPRLANLLAREPESLPGTAQFNGDNKPDYVPYNGRHAPRPRP